MGNKQAGTKSPRTSGDLYLLAVQKAKANAILIDPETAKKKRKRKKHRKKRRHEDVGASQMLTANAMQNAKTKAMLKRVFQRDSITSCGMTPEDRNSEDRNS